MLFNCTVHDYSLFIVSSLYLSSSGGHPLIQSMTDGYLESRNRHIQEDLTDHQGQVHQEVHEQIRTLESYLKPSMDVKQIGQSWGKRCWYSINNFDEVIKRLKSYSCLSNVNVTTCIYCDNILQNTGYSYWQVCCCPCRQGPQQYSFNNITQTVRKEIRWWHFHSLGNLIYIRFHNRNLHGRNMSTIYG